jgi:hypothetical protein
MKKNYNHTNFFLTIVKIMDDYRREKKAEYEKKNRV